MNMKKIHFILGFLLIILIVLYFRDGSLLFLTKYFEWGLKKQTLQIVGNKTNQTLIIEKILEWENNPSNMVNVIGPLTNSNLTFIEKFSFRFFCKSLNPLWIFTFRCGACGEFSTLFVEFTKSLEMSSRVICNCGIDHTFAEVLNNGEWVPVETTSPKGYNDSKFYNEEWLETLSAIYYLDKNGNPNYITENYIKNGGTLIVNVYQDNKPFSNAKVIVKALRCNIVDHTNTDGISLFYLGEGDYTVISEVGFINKLKDNRTIQLESNQKRGINLHLKPYFDTFELKILILVICLFLLTIVVCRVLFKKFNKPRTR